MFSKRPSRRKRCSRNEKPRKLIKELYLSFEHVDSWRGVQLGVTWVDGAFTLAICRMPAGNAL